METMNQIPETLPQNKLSPILDYVFTAATIIKPDVFFDEETGKMYFYGSPMIFRFIYRYNHSSDKPNYKKLDKLKERKDEFFSNKELQDKLNLFTLSPDKFWLLLLFIYDFSWNQCTHGIGNITPLDTLRSALNHIMSNIETHSLRTPFLKEKTSITLKTGKKKYTIEDDLTLIRICSAIQKNIMANEEEWKSLSLDFLLKSTTAESTSVLAYTFYHHLSNFFTKFQPIVSRRKNPQNTSLKEKDLIAHLIYFTDIIQSESIITDPSYLKTLIKRYKDYQLPNGSFSY